MRALGISCAGGGSSRLSRNFVKLLSIISVTFSAVSADAQHRQDEQLNKPEQRVETSTPMVNIFSNFHVNMISFISNFLKGNVASIFGTLGSERKLENTFLVYIISPSEDKS